jgi:molybdopterin biosynthesis enzyme
MRGNEPHKGFFEMITVENALEIIKLHSPMYDLGTKETRADRDYPPFNRVMMDGIAIRFDDYDKGMRSFPIEGISAAGEKAKTLRSGSLEVMTGSVLPLNSDLVIQYEHLKIENNIATIVVEVPRFRFDSVHLEGSDCKKGDVVLLKNLPMTGPHVGILSSMVGVYYYMKVVIAMYAKPANETKIEISLTNQLVMWLCLVLILITGIMPSLVTGLF